MADRYLLESGAPDGYLLEDSSGVLLLDTSSAPQDDSDWSIVDQLTSVATKLGAAALALATTIGFGLQQYDETYEPPPVAAAYSTPASNQRAVSQTRFQLWEYVDDLPVASLAITPQTSTQLAVTGQNSALGAGIQETTGGANLTGQNSTTQTNTLETSGALTLTGQNSTTQIGALESSGSLLLTGQYPNVNLSASPAGTAAYAGNQRAVSQTRFQFWDYTDELPASGIISPQSGSLTLTGNQPYTPFVPEEDYWFRLFSDPYVTSVIYMVDGTSAQYPTIEEESWAAPTVKPPKLITPLFEDYDSYAPTASGLTATPQTSGLLLTGQNSTTQTNTLETSGALALTGQNSTAQIGTLESSGALALTGQNSTVQTTILETSGILLLNGWQPTVQITVAGTIIPQTAGLLVTGQNSTTQGNTRETSGTLTLSGNAPSLDYGKFPQSNGLTLTGQKSTTQTGALESTGSLVITGQNSTVQINTLESSGGLLIVGQAPTAGIWTTPPIYIYPLSGVLSIYGQPANTGTFYYGQGSTIRVHNRTALMILPLRVAGNAYEGPTI